MYKRWTQTAICIAAAAICIFAQAAEGSDSSAGESIAAPPASLELDAFYKKFLDCDGIPVVSSERVADAALFRVDTLIDKMLADREDLRKALVESRVRIVIIGANEQTTDIPEYSHMEPEEYINERSRGFGGRICSCGEENLLCYPIDRYDDESIFVHEFAHTIHGYGLRRIDRSFDRKLRELYDSALAKGLWKYTYAASNPSEYWAEGVQAYYDTNREKNWNHNHVSTREELAEYDPELEAFIAGVFRHTEQTDWRYKPVAPQPRPTTPPAKLKVDPFYRKYVDARSLPILSSEDVSGEALLEANHIVRQVFAYRHDILKAMIDGGLQLVVVGRNESLSDLPEFGDAEDGPFRGATFSAETNTLACSEESLLNPPRNSRGGECALIGALARAMCAMVAHRPIDPEYETRQRQQYELRVDRIDERFHEQLVARFDGARKNGRWAGTPAVESPEDYWAAGVQSWFDAGSADLRPRGQDKAVDTREALESYDPDLARFVADIFLHDVRYDWRYAPRSERE